MSFFTPRLISLLGATFLAAGTVALAAPPIDDALAMGLTFGAIHLAYGVALYVARLSQCAGWPLFRHLC